MSRKIGTIFVVITAVLSFILGSCTAPNSSKIGDRRVDDTVIPLMDRTTPAVVKTATFALGWFWFPESRFGVIDGVVRTRVGYAGGTTADPYYEDVGDHSEAVEMDYDPTIVSYEQLLDVFWASHDPTYPDYSQRTKAIIFYHDEEQKRAALESKQCQELKLDGKVLTEIIPATKFYLAEVQYQKYELQQVPELTTDVLPIMLNSKGSLIDSTALARINGYVGGNGTMGKLVEQLDSLGLSEKGKKKLLEAATFMGLAPACPSNF